eukprot:COSAG06_NODE_11724_length_1472_cov_1.892935_2_plen_194_part_01
MTAAAAAAAVAVGSLSLALAKLLFQEGRKPEAFELCAAVFTQFEAAAGLQPEPEQQQPEQQQEQQPEQSVLRRDAQAVAVAEAAEAYQLGGWVKIHSDDHSSAYSVWSRGHAAVPTCPFLARQAGKRVFFSRLYIKMLILPRQARDKHRESTQKQTVFLQASAPAGMERQQIPLRAAAVTAAAAAAGGCSCSSA